MTTALEIDRRVDTGVTLLELLVAMVIVVVLIVAVAAAFPYLRSYNLQTECVHRMKQLGVGFHLYAGEHGNYLPAQFEDGAKPETAISSPTSWTGQLYPYVNNYRFMSCPTSPNARVRPPNSYYYNGYVARSNARLSLSREASKDVLLIDQWSKTSSYALFTTAPQKDPITQSLGGAFPHPKPPENYSDPLSSSSARRSVLYVDGHVELLRPIPQEAILMKNWLWSVR